MQDTAAEAAVSTLARTRPASAGGRTLPVLVVSLALSLLAMAVWFGGLAGLLYLALYLAAVVPGLPVGWRLFGRSNPAGWVAGGLIGYGLTTLAFWVPLRLGFPNPVAFCAAWLLLLAGLWHGFRRRGDPLVILPRWTRRDWLAWLLVLHLVPVFLTLPFGNVGARDGSGARFYRAYFTADFAWHLTVLNEIRHFEQPPRNPFLAREPIHYYWTYFVVPAVLSGPAEFAVVPAQTVLKVNATLTALLLLSMIHFVAWGVTRRGWSAAAATALVFLAPSLEGTYTLFDLARRGRPLDAVRDMNIDAITAWTFQGLRVDNLVRTMWYTPQHALSLALGLVAVLAVLTGRPTRFAFRALCGVALGLSVTVNPFLGAAFCLIYGTAIVADVLTRRLPARALLEEGAAVVPVTMALAWCLFNHMNDPAGSTITIGLVADTGHWAICIALSFGGILGVVLLGLWPWRGADWRAVVPGGTALVAGFLLMHVVSLEDRSWVSFRAGNLLLATMPMLAARAIGCLRSHAGARTAAFVFSVCLVAGIPTTLIDTYNAQDIHNLSEGPGFPWTIVHTPAQQGGFRWIQEFTAPTAIVQADPTVRDRRNWCLIPGFAARRMAGGLPFSLLPNPDFQRVSQEVHALLTTLTAEETHRQARAMGIGYLWLDQDDGEPGAAAIERFAERPDLFHIPYHRAEVAIVHVQ